MQKVSSGFSQSISSIKQWLTRFGLVEKDSSICKVQLDMNICLPEPELSESVKAEDAQDGESSGQKPAKVEDPWTNKSSVFDAVLEKVSKISDFR